MDDAATPKVMIIGSDEGFCYLMRRYVIECGCEALLEGCTLQSLAVAQREQPAVILLEAGQQGTTGREIWEGLRDNRGTQGIPIVLCYWLEEETNALPSGVAFLLQKPILYRDVRNVLADVGALSPAVG